MIFRRLAVLSLALAACPGIGDPAGPGADGTISLGANADAGGLVSIEVRMCPADAGVSPSCGVVSSPLSASLKPDGGLPVAYRVGSGLGTSPVKDWKVIAWINRARWRGARPGRLVGRGDLRAA